MILFGAGLNLKLFLDILTYMEIPVDYVVDNDTNKIGKQYNGIQVISPSDLFKIDGDIIITAIAYIQRIMQQLEKMGLSQRVKSLYEIIKLNNKNVNSEAAQIKAKNICMDLYSRAEWGGAENWNLCVAQWLNKAEYNLELYINDIVKIPKYIKYDNQITEVEFNNNDAFEDIIEYMKKQMPFVFLNSFYGRTYAASICLKCKYPEKVTIINVIHNDDPYSYNVNRAFINFADRFLCVSTKISDNLNNIYGINKDKIFYIGQPVKIDTYFVKQHNIDKSVALKIGYAARLEKKQKRADLMIDFIKYMINSSINAILEIAGDGECRLMIEEYINKNNLNDKVKLLGLLEDEEMSSFWKRQDIYINFSEYEGTSLAMLDAMSYGCVPIVTDVSGVNDWIKDDINGYICPVGDINMIFQKILELENNRTEMMRLSESAQQTVIKNGNKDNYIKSLENVIEIGI